VAWFGRTKMRRTAVTQQNSPRRGRFLRGHEDGMHRKSHEASPSTDARQRCAGGLVEHPLTAEIAANDHHFRVPIPNLADPRGVLAKRMRSKRAKREVDVRWRDHGDELAFVGDKPWIETEQFASAASRFGQGKRRFVENDIAIVIFEVFAGGRGSHRASPM